MNFADILNDIDTEIYANGVGYITGPILNGVLHNMASMDVRTVKQLTDGDDSPTDGTIAMDWNARALFDGLGGVSQGWDIRKMYNAAGDEMIDYENAMLRHYFTSNGTVQWNNMYLVRNNGTMSIDWFQGLMSTSGGATTLDWSNAYQTDLSGQPSIKWSDRQLIDSLGAVVLDWSVGLSIPAVNDGRFITHPSHTGTASWQTPVYNSRLENALSGSVIAVPDADYTITAANSISMFELATITANRNLNLPAAMALGTQLYIWNKNATAFKWQLSGLGIVDEFGTVISQLNNNTVYKLINKVGGWAIQSRVGQDHAGGTPTCVAGAQMGTSPGAITVTGDDRSGFISFTTGTGLGGTVSGSATVLTMTYAVPYGAGQTVIWFRIQGNNITNMNVFGVNGGTTAVALGMGGGGAQLASSTLYTLGYLVIPALK